MLFNQLLDRPQAQILWDYNHMKQALRPADFLMVLCGYNLDVADYVDILSMQKMGKFVALAGGSDDTQGMARMPWHDKESHIFLERLIELGGKEEQIVVEDESLKTHECFTNMKDLLKDNDPEVTTGLIVTTPHMERRAFATAQVNWPEVEWQVTSPNILYDAYADKYDEESLIQLLVGDTWKVKNYAKEGWITKQEMSPEVEDAMNALIKKGYTGHIPQD